LIYSSLIDKAAGKHINFEVTYSELEPQAIYTQAKMPPLIAIGTVTFFMYASFITFLMTNAQLENFAESGID
jgi:hypothetical protein